MSERGEIERDGAKAQKNSGRGAYQKGDATLGDFLYDIKEYAKSFSLSRTVWAKICTDAATHNNAIPALKIVLGEGREKVRLWVVDDHTFHMMRKAYEDANID